VELRVISHPLVDHKLPLLRSRTTEQPIFRRLVEELELLERMTADELVDARYERFRRMGKDALC